MGFFDSIAYKISLKNFEKDPLELSGIQTNITTELESTEQINNWCFEIIFKLNEISSSILSFFYFFDFKSYSLSNKDENS